MKLHKLVFPVENLNIESALSNIWCKDDNKDLSENTLTKCNISTRNIYEII